MEKKNLFYLLVLSFVFVLSGCVVRTYQMTKDRLDQDLSAGNRGYLQGSVPTETGERKATRTTRVIEIEIHSPIKFDTKPIAKPVEPVSAIAQTQEEEIAGNRGYLMQSETTQKIENLEKYTVQKRDTLQKISKKFYGTTKNWKKIYETNKDILKTPNKLYPGQVINIPSEGLKETKENLK